MISIRSRAAVCVLLLGVAMALRPSVSWATFTDSVPVSGSTLKTFTVPTTTLNCGTLGLLSVSFNWTAVAGATNYTLHYGKGGNTTLDTTKTTATVNGVVSGAPAWVTVHRNFGSTTWTSAESNHRTYTILLGAVGLCS